MTAEPAPRRWRTLAIVGGTVVVALAALTGLVASGVIWPGRIFAAGYDVRGVDVSSYQGDIDWQVLADEDIEFAYIKATEGSSYIDSRFADNWEAAADTALLTGAYHFLSYESTSKEQAAHVIDTVPVDGTLPVAVDVECYAEFCEEPPSRERVAEILDPLLAELEAHYGVAPVIYATADYYDRYVAGSYEDNPIWIRSVITPPSLSDGRDWAIWQYSHRDRLDGYDGDEPFIDMNAVSGSLDELAVRH
ncbi:GH25 family lysozyme [Microbacterium sp. G2-8]|uniref:GH25 family lysozyme n=1 Tax=Microbacterium sp. G2-8 TaxID=2842454 RepID=UPI001C88EFEF|nr:GH25 family lysozyme [Microbacterium sp. G2-8]